MHRSVKVGLVVALATSAIVVAGIGGTRGLGLGQASNQVAATTVDDGKLLAPTAGAGGGLDATIQALQQRLARVPEDWRSFATLGLAYVQQARITSDPSFYPKAEGVLQASLALSPEDNAGALVGMAALAAARHDFSAALRYGRQARQVDPHDGNVYGVIGDALLELGRYDDAFATFQTMVDTLPSLSSYARVSYSRELLGDVDGAIASMEAARDVAGSPADLAWASHQLGELYFNSGRVERAAREYGRGLSADPSFVPNLAGMAQVSWARGATDLAIERYEEVVRRLPTPAYVTTLGDLYATVGRRRGRPAVLRAGPSRSATLRRERGRHRPGTRAVRRRSRRSRGRPAGRARRVGPAPEHQRRRRLGLGAARRTGGTTRRPDTPSAPSRSARPTRSSCSTPG